MKKAIALMSAALVICGIVLTGCGQKKQQDQAGQQNGTQQQSKMEQKGEAEQAVPSGSADKNEKIIIKAADTQPLDHPMHLGFLKFKEIVESKTDEIQVEVYGNSVLGSDSEVTEGVQMGTIQIGTCGTSNLAEFTDAFLVFDLPYIFPTVEDAEKVLDGEIGQDMLKKLEDKGLMGLAYTELGYRNVFNSIKPIEKLDDMKGLKLRSTSSPIHIAILEALGANPTPLSFGEVYTALQQGALDGVDQDLNLAWASRFQEVQKYLTLTQSSYFPHVFLINKDFFEGLSLENQKIITDAAKEMAKYERELVRENENTMIEKMKSDGIQIIELSDDEKARWVEAVQPVYKQFEEQIGADVIKQVQDAIAQ